MSQRQSLAKITNYLMFFAVIVIAASNYVVCKIALQTVKPFTLMSVRYIIAVLLLLIFLLPRLKHLHHRLVIKGVILGCCLSFAVISWQFGLFFSDTIGPAAFIVSLDGLFVPLMAIVFFREQLTANVLFAIPLALVGLALLNLKQGMSLDISNIWFLLSAFGFSTHILLTHRYARQFDPVCFVWFQMVTVAVITTAMMMGFEVSEVTWGQVASVGYELLYLGVVATAARFILQNYAQKGVSASVAGFLFVLEPVMVALFAWVVFSETLSVYQLLGSAFILIAVIFSHGELKLRDLLGRRGYARTGSTE